MSDAFFLYVAIFLVYKQKHPNSKERYLLDDLFTLGSASKTKDMLPETNAICDLCASVYYPNLRLAPPDHIRDINIQVFLEQKKNRFLRPNIAKILIKIKQGFVFDSVGSEDISDCSEDKDKTVEDIKGFNPFSSDEELDCGSYSNQENCCKVCEKSFSLSEFLIYHDKIFHDKKDVMPPNNDLKFLTSKFVPEAEDLITSFVAPEHSNASKKRKANQDKKKASKFLPEQVDKVSKISAGNVHKFNLREKSKRNLNFGE